MEYQKIANSLAKTSDNVPRFITKKWIEVYDQLSNAEDRYQPSKQIRFKTSMVRSDLCNFSDAYIVVKGTITLIRTNGRGIIDIRNKFLAFKNNVPFTNCMWKTNNILTDNAEDLDVVMPTHNLLECSKNHAKTTGSLRNNYRDETNGFPANNYNVNSIKNSDCFKYKSSITGKTWNASRQNGENTERGNTKTKKNLEIVVPLKHLKQFLENFRHMFD